MNMADNTRFAVVLCSHNGARFIDEQIRSILDQSDSIVVHVHDFASRDETHALLDNLRTEVRDRLQVTLHDVAPGAAASFIVALRHTLPSLPDDTLIFFSDQDDVWCPQKLAAITLEIQHRGLSAEEPFLLFHDVTVVDADLTPIRPTYYTGNPFRVPRDLDRRRLMMANPAIGHTMLLSTPLARIVADWPDSDRYLMHDWLAILLASRIGRVEQVPYQLSLYRQHDSNVLGAYRTRGRISSLSRLLGFVDRMTRQALHFAQMIDEAPPAGRRVRTTYLDRLCRRGYRSTALALAWAAGVHGPTWQRKAIGLLLLTRAIIGPKNNPPADHPRQKVTT